MSATVLSGRKMICQYCQRSWEIVLRWYRERGFPMRKIDDVWESDQVLIDEWRRKEIRASKKGCQDNS